MAKNSKLIFALLLCYVTQSKTIDVPLNEQSDQSTHIDLLNVNHDLFLNDNTNHQTDEQVHHHRRRHHHGESLKYFNYCRYIRNEDCDNDKCCHIECAKANLEHNDQRKVCRHNCVQHCQNYLVEKYNVKIDVIEHPTKNQDPGGIIEMINSTQDPNSILPEQKLCCFIDVPENCQRISQYPFVKCDIKQKSTCGPQCLKKVVDINYQTGIIYQPTQTLPPSYRIIYYQQQYPNYYYYPQQQYSTYDFQYTQNPYYQYPYYQNSYYQYPYQNYYYQNSYYQNPYYQNPYYQNYDYQYYPNSYYQNSIYYYRPIQQYPPIFLHPGTTTSKPVVTTTEKNANENGERPTDYQNDEESNDLPNDILPESYDFSKEITTETKIE